MGLISSILTLQCSPISMVVTNELTKKKNRNLKSYTVESTSLSQSTLYLCFVVNCPCLHFLLIASLGKGGRLLLSFNKCKATVKLVAMLGLVPSAHEMENAFTCAQERPASFT